MDSPISPAFWFVIATLLPLASFVGNLVVSGLWCLARRYPRSPGMDALYQMTGGDKPGPGPAYVALGAIALAFFCSLIGFVQYGLDYYETTARPKAILEKEIHKLEDEIPELKKERKELQAEFAEVGKEFTAEKNRDSKANLELYLLAIEADEFFLGKTIADKEKALHEAEESLARHESIWERHRKKIWKGRLFEVARIRSLVSNDPDRGSALEIGYSIDSLSALMFVMVTLIASLIHLFSIGYMKEELEEEVTDHHVHGDQHHAGGAHHGDPIHHHTEHFKRRGRFGRFFTYLSLFCFSMLNLVLASNLFQIFVSWELVGICSYLLIGFYYERRSAANAANKAFITNRIGDAGFIVGLMIIFGFVGTFDFDELFARIRAPVEVEAHGHTEQVSTAGKFIRGNEVKADNGETHFRFAPDGDRVLLFPKQPHIHAEELQPTDAEGNPNDLTSHGHPIQVKDNPEKGDPALITANPRKRDFSSMPYWMLVAAGLGIFLGCVGKSAQFPLQVWLPDAMEGPTPVSALIHAATMVAAGVYLVGRVYPLFTADVLLTIAYVGGITLFVAATIAIVATDIKKVLAYSTVSQLGYMMLALGIGGWTAGLFHLFTHAFFKALLFLGSGSVIYGCHHEQEMTKMGGLFPKMRITALTMLVGVLAIAGTPLFSGWYSKDSIVAQAFGFASVHREHSLLFILPLMTAGITTFYMFRMWFMTFTGKPRDHHVYDHAHESPWTMTVPLIVLAAFAFFVAWGSRPWDASNSFLESTIHQSQPVSVMADFGPVHDHHEHFHSISDAEAAKMERHKAHELHDLGGLMALGMAGLGFAFALVTYYWRYLDPEDAKAQFPGVHAFLANKWYFDDLYAVLLVRPTVIVAQAFRAFDLNWIDGLIHGVARFAVGLSRWAGRFDNNIVDYLVNVLGKATYGLGSSLRGLQTGSLRNYVLFLAIAAVALFAVLAYFVSFAVAR